MSYRTDATEGAPIVVLSFPGTILGLHTSDGSIAWEHSINPGRFEIVDGLVFVSCTDAVACLDYVTGKLVWKSPAKMAGHVHVDEARVYVVGGVEAECFTRSGQPLWHQPLKGRGNMRTTGGIPGSVKQDV